MTVQDDLLGWYRRNRRPLPWRETSDPYAIWVSEAMLQQTRVETVESYWTRFLERFPTVHELARADEEDVLALWSGLGYYRRARSLHAAAQVIVERHGGEFPRTRDELLALPGVGPYTAGAVLSIAFDLPEPLVDGNVGRVFARLFALEGTTGSSELQRDLWQLAGELVPREGAAGDWNQALMELGATVCTPRDPNCPACPLAEGCRARSAGRTAELPWPKPKVPSIEVALETVVVRDGDALLLERRPASGRMAGMWQFPTVERAGPGGAHSGLFPSELPAGIRPESGAGLGGFRHGITRHRIRVELRSGRVSGRVREPLAWVPSERLGELPLTGMTKKTLRSLADSGTR
jgi:A/G-specific adenine glycosylase